LATVVLIHGSYCGGWSWKKVAPPLRAAGHEVYTPTLTGLGERSHLLTSEVNLSTHVQDIVNLLFYEDLRDVILLGWSYSGMVITGVAEQVPERVRHLIYLDAAIPEDGQAAFDLVEGLRDQWLANAIDVNGARAKATADRQWIIDGWKIADPSDVDWIEARITPMPIETNEERINLPAHHARQLPRSFISCARNDALAPLAQKARAEGWDYHELPREHFEIIAVPDELVAVLLQIAENSGSHVE
jgi:pimeloyl-ACP methyl ester carboxylesterase